MKGTTIDHEKMKKLFEAYLAEKTPQKRKDCPTPDSIYLLFQSNTPEIIRNETLSHLLKCSHCTKEFQFVLSTLREEKKFIDDVKDVLSGNRIYRREKRFKSFFFNLSWKYAYFLIGAAILLVIFMLNIPNKHVYRGTKHESIRLISPLDQRYLKSDLLFEWEMVENSEYFILEIFDQSLYPIWKSEKITTHRIKLSSKALEKLDSNQFYYWIVIAFMPNDRILESQLQKFGLTR